VNVGKKAVDGIVELVTRSTKSSEDIPLETAAKQIHERVQAATPVALT
jgi:hypothetical protein